MKSALEFNHIPEVMQLIQSVSQQILSEEPIEIINDVKAQMNEPKSGRVYKRRSVEHRASAPGQAPAIDTGALVNSLIWNKLGTTGAEVIEGVEGKNYAHALEFGRPEHNLAPRPHMKPAANRAKQRITKSFRELAKRIENV